MFNRTIICAAAMLLCEKEDVQELVRIFFVSSSD